MTPPSSHLPVAAPHARAQSPPAQPAAAESPSIPTGRAVPSSRRPRQQRGERRVQTILDAAASLIAESGTERLTVQMLADRANTSKGSLYHFFADLPSVIRALGDRHFAAVSGLTGGMIADPSIKWRALSVDATVEHFLAPLAYLEANPDLLALVRVPVPAEELGERLAPIRDLAAHLLAERCAALPGAQRMAAAMTMVGMLDGVVGYALRTGDVSAEQLTTELRRALVAYLSRLEEIARAAASARTDGGGRQIHAEGRAHAGRARQP